MTEHKSVLIKEALEYLNVKPGERYIDCNLGGGGHTQAMLEKGANVLAFELDQYAITQASKRLIDYINQKKLLILNQNFSKIAEEAQKHHFTNISGILYDLGLSTFQLKDETKGFSFYEDVLMDMRMDESLNVTANDLLKGLSEKELTRLFQEYGEEPQAKKFAAALKKEVAKGKELTAKEVAEILKNTSKYPISRIHPATRVFQAFRIAVNSELENFEISLRAAIPLLKSEGRLVTITFHALEDKIAKNLAGSPQIKTVLDRPITASNNEIESNPSSRSAKMRVYEKI